MIDLLSQTEGLPASYPTVTGLSTEAQALDASALWQRIESYIRHRWNTRTVTWIVDGCGAWIPTLDPYTIDGVKLWDGDSYEATTLPATPLGLYFEDYGTYEITATVGDTATPPEGVLEAFRRLAEYTADGVKFNRASGDYAVNIGPIQENISRHQNFMARAIQHSGAADLLRAYR